MKKQLEQQNRDLQERRQQFEEDKHNFDHEYQDWLEKETQKQAGSLDRRT